MCLSVNRSIQSRSVCHSHTIALAYWQPRPLAANVHGENYFGCGHVLAKFICFGLQMEKFTTYPKDCS